MFHINRRRLVLASTFLMGSATVQAAAPQPELTLAIARTMITACANHATTKGWKMNIAVVDSGANLIAFERMDHAYLGSGEIALNKAQTSAKFPFPTRVVEGLAYGNGVKQAAIPGLAHVRGIIAFAGGLPLMVGSTHLGGIGVSGGTPDEDESCAQTAVDAVKSMVSGDGA
jgi:glc operon protein GlcG